MDGFELNKVAGALLSALLVLFGTRTLAEIVFTVHTPETPGWEVAIPESIETPAADEGEQEEPLAALLAEASAENGERAANKCTSCHSFEAGGPNKTGPGLHGVLGNPVAAHEGFAYSGALKEKGGEWGYEELDDFIANPRGYAPGTKMAFAGVKSAAERADLIAYLRSLEDDPPPLPEPPAGEDKEAEEGQAGENGEQEPGDGAQQDGQQGDRPAREQEDQPRQQEQQEQQEESQPEQQEGEANGKPAETEDAKPAVPETEQQPQGQETPDAPEPDKPAEPDAGKPARSQ